MEERVIGPVRVVFGFEGGAFVVRLFALDGTKLDGYRPESESEVEAVLAVIAEMVEGEGGEVPVAPLRAVSVFGYPGKVRIVLPSGDKSDEADVQLVRSSIESAGLSAGVVESSRLGSDDDARAYGVTAKVCVVATVPPGEDVDRTLDSLRRVFAVSGVGWIFVPMEGFRGAEVRQPPRGAQGVVRHTGVSVAPEGHKVRVYVGQSRSKKMIEKLAEYGFREMVSRGEQPPRRLTHAQDNGAFGDWQNGRPFDEVAFQNDVWRCSVSAYPSPDFIVIPDKVADAKATFAMAREWIPKIRDINARRPVPLAFVLQDGMTEADVDSIVSEVEILFVGGSLEWKWATVEAWTEYAHAKGKRIHVGRVGTETTVRRCLELGVDSFDSTTPLQSMANLQRFLKGFEGNWHRVDKEGVSVATHAAVASARAVEDARLAKLFPVEDDADGDDFGGTDEGDFGGVDEAPVDAVPPVVAEDFGGTDEDDFGGADEAPVVTPQPAEEPLPDLWEMFTPVASSAASEEDERELESVCSRLDDVATDPAVLNGTYDREGRKWAGGVLYAVRVVNDPRRYLTVKELARWNKIPEASKPVGVRREFVRRAIERVTPDLKRATEIIAQEETKEDASKEEDRGSLWCGSDLDVEVARSLMREAGVASDKSDNDGYPLHITLFFSGKLSALPGDAGDRMVAVVRECVEAHPPIVVRTGKVGSFEKEPIPYYLEVSGESLFSFREELVRRVEAANLTVDKTFPVWHPHITLAYGEKPADEPRPREVTLTTVTVVAGKVRHTFAFKVPASQPVPAAAIETKSLLEELLDAMPEPAKSPQAVKQAAKTVFEVIRETPEGTPVTIALRHEFRTPTHIDNVSVVIGRFSSAEMRDGSCVIRFKNRAPEEVSAQHLVAFWRASVDPKDIHINGRSGNGVQEFLARVALAKTPPVAVGFIDQPTDAVSWVESPFENTDLPPKIMEAAWQWLRSESFKLKLVRRLIAAERHDKPRELLATIEENLRLSTFAVVTDSPEGARFAPSSEFVFVFRSSVDGLQAKPLAAYRRDGAKINSFPGGFLNWRTVAQSSLSEVYGDRVWSSEEGSLFELVRRAHIEAGDIYDADEVSAYDGAINLPRPVSSEESVRVSLRIDTRDLSMVPFGTRAQTDGGGLNVERYAEIPLIHLGSTVHFAGLARELKTNTAGLISQIRRALASIAPDVEVRRYACNALINPYDKGVPAYVRQAAVYVGAGDEDALYAVRGAVARELEKIGLRETGEYADEHLPLLYLGRESLPPKDFTPFAVTVTALALRVGTEVYPYSGKDVGNAFTAPSLRPVTPFLVRFKRGDLVTVTEDGMSKPYTVEKEHARTPRTSPGNRIYEVSNRAGTTRVKLAQMAPATVDPAKAPRVQALSVGGVDGKRYTLKDCVEELKEAAEAYVREKKSKRMNLSTLKLRAMSAMAFYLPLQGLGGSLREDDPFASLVAVLMAEATAETNVKELLADRAADVERFQKISGNVLIVAGELRDRKHRETGAALEEKDIQDRTTWLSQQVKKLGWIKEMWMLEDAIPSPETDPTKGSSHKEDADGASNGDDFGGADAGEVAPAAPVAPPASKPKAGVFRASIETNANAVDVFIPFPATWEADATAAGMDPKTWAEWWSGLKARLPQRFDAALTAAGITPSTRFNGSDRQKASSLGAPVPQGMGVGAQLDGVDKEKARDLVVVLEFWLKDEGFAVETHRRTDQDITGGFLPPLEGRAATGVEGTDYGFGVRDVPIAEAAKMVTETGGQLWHGTTPPRRHEMPDGALLFNMQFGGRHDVYRLVPDIADADAERHVRSLDAAGRKALIERLEARLATAEDFVRRVKMDERPHVHHLVMSEAERKDAFRLLSLARALDEEMSRPAESTPVESPREQAPSVVMVADGTIPVASESDLILKPYYTNDGSVDVRAKNYVLAGWLCCAFNGRMEFSKYAIRRLNPPYTMSDGVEEWHTSLEGSVLPDDSVLAAVRAGQAPLAVLPSGVGDATAADTMTRFLVGTSSGYASMRGFDYFNARAFVRAMMKSETAQAWLENVEVNAHGALRVCLYRTNESRVFFVAYDEANMPESEKSGKKLSGKYLRAETADAMGPWRLVDPYLRERFPPPTPAGRTFMWMLSLQDCHERSGYKRVKELALITDAHYLMVWNALRCGWPVPPSAVEAYPWLVEAYGTATSAAAAEDVNNPEDPDLILRHSAEHGTTIHTKPDDRTWNRAILDLRNGFRWFEDHWYRTNSRGNQKPTIALDVFANRLRRAGAKVKVELSLTSAEEAARIKREHKAENAARSADKALKWLEKSKRLFGEAGDAANRALTANTERRSRLAKSKSHRVLGEAKKYADRAERYARRSVNVARDARVDPQTIAEYRASHQEIRGESDDILTTKANDLTGRVDAFRNARNAAPGLAFFATPDWLAARMADETGIGPGDVVMDPSAGMGALLDAAAERGAKVLGVELSLDRFQYLSKKYENVDGVQVVHDDFMDVGDAIPSSFDAVLINPPFSSESNRVLFADHVARALEYLRPEGFIAAIVPASFAYSEDKRVAALRTQFEEMGATVEPLPDDTFKEAGTMVRTLLLVAQKPGDGTPEESPKSETESVETAPVQTEDLVSKMERKSAADAAYEAQFVFHQSPDLRVPCDVCGFGGNAATINAAGRMYTRHRAVRGSESKVPGEMNGYVVDPEDMHMNPTPGSPCPVCGIPARVRARHWRLSQAERVDGGRGRYAKEIKVAFGMDSTTIVLDENGKQV